MVRGCIDPKTGGFIKIDHKKIREEQMYTYRAHEDGHYCFCQMCETAKPRDYIEVTSLQHEPPIYLPAAYLSLCLECSRRYHGLTASSNSAFTKLLYQQIKNTHVLGIGKVVVKVADYDVQLRFTDAHFLQIQTYVQSLAQISSAPADAQKGESIATAGIPKQGTERKKVHVVGEDAGDYLLVPFNAPLKKATSQPTEKRTVAIQRGGKVMNCEVFLVRNEGALYIPSAAYVNDALYLIQAKEVELKR